MSARKRTGDRSGPERISDALAGFLDESGLAERVRQSAVVPEWGAIVGAEIAAVTAPLFVTADGTLFVAARTHAWMTELQLIEPELIRALRAHPAGSGVRRLRFQLAREP